MIESKSYITTRMAFIPGEDVQRKIVELLDPFVVDRLSRDGQELTFYSVESYPSEVAMVDIALRNFVKTTEGAAVPYPSIAYSAWSEPGAVETTSTQGLVIDIAVDVSEDDNIARGAELLGFSDNNRVMARLALMQQQLVNGRINSSRASDLEEYVRSSSQYATIGFIQRSLTK